MRYIPMGKPALDQRIDFTQDQTERVFRDREGDSWFEVEPGQFTWAGSWEVARHKHASTRYELARKPLSWVRAEFGPLLKVTK